VRIGGIDWEKLGHAFGADAAVVETEKALGDALTSSQVGPHHADRRPH
jgi:hypothetical protein